MVFGKKKLEKQLAELALQSQQKEQEQRWREAQMQEHLRAQEEEHRRRESQWEQEQQERQRREHEQQQERQRREHEQREKERRERELREKKWLDKKKRDEERAKRLKSTSPESLRGLRELIRARYQLDMDIWSLKGARGPDRPIVVEKMQKADAVLMEIYTIVKTWEASDKIWTAEEWKLAQNIKERILADGKRWWVNNPPWNEA